MSLRILTASAGLGAIAYTTHRIKKNAPLLHATEALKSKKFVIEEVPEKDVVGVTIRAPYGGVDQNKKENFPAGDSPGWIWQRKGEEPKSVVKLGGAAPITHFLHKCFKEYPPESHRIACIKPLQIAGLTWEFDERVKRQYGLEVASNLSPEESKLVDYYAEVMRCAVALGFSMPELYQKGPHQRVRIKENGAIAFDQSGLITPLGYFSGTRKFQSKGIEAIELNKEDLAGFSAPIFSVRKRTNGEENPMAELIVNDEQNDQALAIWRRIRPAVFTKLNQRPNSQFK